MDLQEELHKHDRELELMDWSMHAARLLLPEGKNEEEPQKEEAKSRSMTRKWSGEPARD